MNVPFSDLKWYLVIILLVLILVSLLFLTFRSNSFRTSNLSNNQQALSCDFSVYDSISGSVHGKITKVNENKISFENLQNGKTGEADASETISISDMNTNELPSASLSKIQINKAASINLSIKDCKQIITSIIYPQ